MINKIIKIGGVDVPMRASASTPRFYRTKIGKDLFADMQKLSVAAENNKNGEQFQNVEIEVFENIAYIMAWTADVDEDGRHLHNVPDDLPTIDDNIGKWLDTFDLFSIYEALPQILELWNLNTVQMSTSKKKIEQ